jgi:nitroreductase
MDVFTAIQNRKSIRQFTGEPVSRDDLIKIVDAGRCAPTGNNRQPWEFIIITEKKMISRLNKAADWMDKAGAIIAVVMDSTTRWWLEDGAAAIENMLLACTALGYGACWLEGYTNPLEAEFKDLLDIPDDRRLMTLVPIGIPAESPDREKKPLEEVLHWERYCC